MTAKRAQLLQCAGGASFAVAVLASIGVVACAVFGGGAWTTAWLFAAFVLLQPALGSVFMLLIHRMTGGQWADGLRPFLHAGAALAPWIWLLVLPLLFVPGRPGGTIPEAEGSLAIYMATWAQVVRWAVIEVVLIGLSLALRGPVDRGQARWVGPLGFIALLFLLHLAAVDWLATLVKGWYSTGFPLIWMAGQTVSGLAAAIAWSVAAGVNPAELGKSQRPRGIDWGNLLLATVLFWTYVAFTHFLIMWMGNISVEVAWYVERSKPGWVAVAVVLAVCHFLVPLLALFFRSFKRSPALLGWLAVALVLLQALYTAWMIFPSAGISPMSTALAAALGLAVLALYFGGYARIARRVAEVAA